MRSLQLLSLGELIGNQRGQLGDNSCSAGGRFYEGAIVSGPVVSKEIVDALQAAIVAAKYEK